MFEIATAVMIRKNCHVIGCSILTISRTTRVMRDLRANPSESHTTVRYITDLQEHETGPGKGSSSIQRAAPCTGDGHIVVSGHSSIDPSGIAAVALPLLSYQEDELKYRPGMLHDHYRREECRGSGYRCAQDST